MKVMSQESIMENMAHLNKISQVIIIYHKQRHHIDSDSGSGSRSKKYHSGSSKNYKSSKRH
jgi:hypothetical protein